MGNTPSSVPLASQIGQINYPLQCNTQFYFDTYNALLSATAPLYGGPGNGVSFTDVAANISLPEKFAPAALANGSTWFTTSIDLLWGGSVTLANARQVLSLNQTWDDTTLRIYNPKLPATLSQSNTASLRVQNIFITTTARRPDGSVVSQISTNCFLGSDNIVSIKTGDVAGPREPSNGRAGDFPAIASGQRASTANVDLVCNNQLTTSLIIGGIVPAASLNASQEIVLSNVTSFFILPGSLVQTLAKEESGIFVELKRPSDGQNGTGDGLVLQTTNASPQSLELSRDFTASETTPNPLNTGHYVPAGHNQPVQYGLPRFGSLSTKLVSTGGYFGLNVSSVDVVITTYSLKTGELTDWRQYSCKPNSRHSIFA